MGDLSRIYTNVAALRAAYTLNTINEGIIASTERIASGLRINRASDSPSGYAHARTLRNQIVTLARRQSSIERGVNFLQTNDSKLAQVADIIQEMIDLANQAKSDAVSSAEKQAIMLEVRQLSTEANEILTSGVSKKIQTSADSAASNLTLGTITDIKVSGAFTTDALTIEAGDLLVTGSAANINAALTNLNTALNKIVNMEEQIGGYISRLEFQQSDAAVTEINTQASLSNVQDTDLVKEQVNLTRLQILQQAAVSSLAQANLNPQVLVGLFGLGR